MRPSESFAKHLAAEYAHGLLTTDEVKHALADWKEGREGRPVSEGQEGLWILQQSYPEMTAYNVPLCFRVKALNVAVFRRACHFLIWRYPILNAFIGRRDGRLQQWEEPDRPVLVHEHDMTLAEPDAPLAAVRSRAKQVFAVDQAPLLAVDVFAMPKDEWVVLFNVHHIVFDGASGAIVWECLSEVYRELLAGGAPALQRPAASFHDFVRHERQLMADGGDALSYWTEKLADLPPPIELGDRGAAGGRRHFAGVTERQLLAPDASDRMRVFAAAQGVHVSTLLLAAYKMVLADPTGRRDLIVGMPVNERRQKRFEKTVGLLINMLPVRSRLKPAETFARFAQQLQNDLVDAIAYSYPFRALVRALDPVRDASVPLRSFKQPSCSRTCSAASTKRAPRSSSCRRSARRVNTSCRWKCLNKVAASCSTGSTTRSASAKRSSGQWRPRSSTSCRLRCRGPSKPSARWSR